MVTDSGRKASPEGTKRLSEDFFDKSRKKIEKYSIVALFCLLAAVIFVSIDQKLVAAIFIIASAGLLVLIFIKSSEVHKRYKESLSEVFSLNEKKDDVITDFSHRIREPLNNLVIISDMLMESGLQKKQKELLETFIASTNNMVTTVNELSMQSAGNLSYEPRKGNTFQSAFHHSEYLRPLHAEG